MTTNFSFQLLPLSTVSEGFCFLQFTGLVITEIWEKKLNPLFIFCEFRHKLKKMKTLLLSDIQFHK